MSLGLLLGQRSRAILLANSFLNMDLHWSFFDVKLSMSVKRENAHIKQNTSCGSWLRLNNPSDKNTSFWLGMEQELVGSASTSLEADGGALR